MRDVEYMDTERSVASVHDAQLYTSLFENSHSVMLIIDPGSGRIVDANEAACRFYGYAKLEIIGMKIMEINTLSPAQIFEEMENAKLLRRKHFNFRHKISTGEIKDVDVYSGPIEIAGRQLLYSIIHDISERKRFERERDLLIDKLEQARSENTALKGILPICASCKKIRDNQGHWHPVEVYIERHSEADFSHGICPECMEDFRREVEKTQK